MGNNGVEPPSPQIKCTVFFRSSFLKIDFFLNIFYIYEQYKIMFVQIGEGKIAKINVKGKFV